MIRYIKGILTEADDQGIVVENQGIGYYIFIPGSMFAGSLPMGEEIRVYTYFHVKEDAMQLYGFQSPDDLEVFRLLLGVSGIGPKAAMGVLSALSADDLRFAVLSDDVKTLSKAPGIGQKTARRMILDLKDKLSLEEAFEKRLEHGKDTAVSGGMSDARAEAVEALVALGYSNADALRAVKAAGGENDMDAEQILREALKQMALR